MKYILELSIESFTRKMMEHAEWNILQRIDWRLNLPTRESFVRLILLSSELHGQYLSDLLEESIYRVELSLLEYSFVKLRPSHIALSCLHSAYASLQVENESFQTFLNTMMNTIGAKKEIIQRCTKKITTAAPTKPSMKQDIPRSPSPTTVTDINSHNSSSYSQEKQLDDCTVTYKEKVTVSPIRSNSKLPIKKRKLDVSPVCYIDKDKCPVANRTRASQKRSTMFNLQQIKE